MNTKQKTIGDDTVISDRSGHAMQKLFVDPETLSPGETRQIIYDLQQELRREDKMLQRHYGELALINRVSQIFNSTLDNIFFIVTSMFNRSLAIASAFKSLSDPNFEAQFNKVARAEE